MALAPGNTYKYKIRTCCKDFKIKAQCYKYKANKACNPCNPNSISANVYILRNCDGEMLILETVNG